MRIVLCLVILLLSGCHTVQEQRSLPERLWGEIPGDEKALMYAAGAGYVHLTTSEMIIQVTGDPDMFRRDFEALFEVTFIRSVQVSETMYRISFQRVQ